MSEIILVRHGQASFGADSYDKLSELGIEQVRILARHWESLGQRFDAVYSGDLLRQRETASELLHLAGADEPFIDPSFNEYNGDPLMLAYLQQHAREEEWGSSIAWPIRDHKLFQQVFEAATARWIRGELQPPDNESGFEAWVDFQQRVHDAIERVMSRHSGGARVLVSTSGGVIAMALQRILKFPDAQVIETNWMVRNSAVSRIKYGNGRASMTQFNSLAHLEREDLQHLVTYR